MRVYSPQSRRGRRVRYFFSFPLRGRKAKTLDPVGNNNILFSDKQFARFCFLAGNCDNFSFAVLSTAKEKFSYSASFESPAERAVRSSLQITHPHSKAGTTSQTWWFKGLIKGNYDYEYGPQR